MIAARVCPHIVLALLFSVLLAVPWAAARYEWRDVRQDVTINPDGTVVILDERTLWTPDESFGEAFICVGHPDHVSLTLLVEASGAVSPGPDATAFQQPCSAGTEVVVRSAQRVTERRVRFVYRLDGTVDAFTDVVQWYWNLIQIDHPPIVGYELTVHAPGPMDSPYDAYVMRYANPEIPRVAISEDRRVLTVEFDRIPHGDGVEVRYLMDPRLFTIRGTRPGLDLLMDDQARVSGVDRGAMGRPNSTLMAAVVRERELLAAEYANVALFLHSDGDVNTRIGIAATVPARFPDPEFHAHATLVCRTGVLDSDDLISFALFLERSGATVQDGEFAFEDVVARCDDAGSVTVGSGNLARTIALIDLFRQASRFGFLVMYGGSSFDQRHVSFAFADAGWISSSNPSSANQSQYRQVRLWGSGIVGASTGFAVVGLDAFDGRGLQQVVFEGEETGRPYDLSAGAVGLFVRGSASRPEWDHLILDAARGEVRWRRTTDGPR